MQTKTITDVEVKDDSKGLVTAVISTFGVIDSDGDVTAKSTFTDGAPVVVSSYGHTSWDGSLPIGTGSIRTNDSEAIADLQFLIDTPHGKAAFDTIAAVSKAGLQEWSYSLEHTVSKVGELDGQPANFIESTVVKEVSPVLRGASINTRTLAIKGEGHTFSEQATAVLAAVDELTARAQEVVALRAEKGKSISEDSAALLTQLAVRLDALKALIDPPADTTPDDVEAEWLRFVSTSAGVTFP